MSVEIQIIGGHVAVVDEQDAPAVKAFRWYGQKSHLGLRERVYACQYTGSHLPMHRFILAMKLARPLRSKELADHVNGNTLDNRRDNLRVVNRTQHRANAAKKQTRTGASSSYIGVSRNKDIGRWGCSVTKNGIRHWPEPRWYETEAEAARARDALAIEVHGRDAGGHPIARLNFADTSVEHLLIPWGVDLDAAYLEYRGREQPDGAEWISFADWLEEGE